MQDVAQDKIQNTARKTALLEAQEKARQLLKRIEQTEIIKVGITEQQASEQIYELAQREFGVTKHWHKRIVRTGINSILPYRANPENLTIEHDDLVYLDLGPVFEDFEGDIGATFLLGDNPEKKKLVGDLQTIFQQCKEYYEYNPAQTGAEFFDYIVDVCVKAGWDYGNRYAGHIIGEFSHIGIYGDLPDYRIWPQNTIPMNEPLPDGNTRFWILEIHLVDRQGKYGGFFEDLLNL